LEGGAIGHACATKEGIDIPPQDGGATGRRIIQVDLDPVKSGGDGDVLNAAVNDCTV
jgi:hypothetical protein